jgi:hypothetical protein
VAELPHGKARVYVVSGTGPGDEGAEERVVEVGITDGVWSELRGGLPAGTEVITEQRDRKKQGKFLGLF